MDSKKAYVKVSWCKAGWWNEWNNDESLVNFTDVFILAYCTMNMKKSLYSTESVHIKEPGNKINFEKVKKKKLERLS